MIGGSLFKFITGISFKHGTIARELFYKSPLNFGKYLARKTGKSIEYIQSLMKKVDDNTATDEDEKELKEIIEKHEPTEEDIKKMNGGRKSRKSKKSKKSKKTKTRRRK